MAKAELKTKATEVSVADYIAALPEPARRADAAALDALYRKITGLEPKMWGPSIIGYGNFGDTGNFGGAILIRPALATQALPVLLRRASCNGGPPSIAGGCSRGLISIAVALEPLILSLSKDAE